jgi:hypothetical protein
MTQLELIELVQQHAPHKGYKEIRAALNRAQNDFAAKTELLKKTYTQNSVAGQRYYEIHSDILKILRVQLDDVEIPRLIGSPIIDDDEFNSETGLTVGTTSSNERYWYIDSGRIGIVEKVTNAITRDGKTSNYQSISEVKEIRLFTIAQPVDFDTTLTNTSSFPPQFHEGLSYKVISDMYLHPSMGNLDNHKIFYTKYMHTVKEGRAYARSGYLESGVIRQVHF